MRLAGHIRGAGIALSWLGSDPQDQFEAEGEADGQGTKKREQRHIACCLREIVGVLVCHDRCGSYCGRGSWGLDNRLGSCCRDWGRGLDNRLSSCCCDRGRGLNNRLGSCCCDRGCGLDNRLSSCCGGGRRGLDCRGYVYYFLVWCDSNNR